MGKPTKASKSMGEGSGTAMMRIGEKSVVVLTLVPMRASNPKRFWPVKDAYEIGTPPPVIVALPGVVVLTKKI